MTPDIKHTVEGASGNIYRHKASTAGGEYSGPCPFCGGTDRFSIHPQTDHYVCRQCKKAGDSIQFLRDFKGMTFKEACLYIGRTPEGLQTAGTGTGTSNSRRANSSDAAKGRPGPVKENKSQAYWDKIFQNGNRDTPYRYFCDGRKLSKETVDTAYDNGLIRFSKHAGKSSVAVPYKDLLTGEVQSVQFLSVDMEPYEFTIQDGEEGKNKVFLSGSTPKSNCFFWIGSDPATATQLIITEGVVDTLTAFEYYPDACCLALGSSTTTSKVKNLCEYLAHDCKVIVATDNNEPSEQMLRKIHDNFDREIKAITWRPDDRPGQDINDLHMAGETDRIRQMIADAEVVHYQIEASDQPIEEIHSISLKDIFHKKPQLTVLVEGLIVKRDATVLTAEGGLGKSMLAFFVALEVAKRQQGLLFDQFPVKERLNSLFLQSENSMAAIFFRASKMVGSNQEYQEALEHVHFPLIEDEALTIGRSFEDAAFILWVVGLIKDIEKRTGQKIHLLWIDPLISFHDGQENDAGRMRAALDGVSQVMQLADVTVIILHHNNRMGAFRGTSAVEDWCRSRISLERVFIASERITDMDAKGNVTGRRTAQIPCIRVKHKKANNLPLFESFTLKMNDKFRFDLIEENLSSTQTETCNLVQQALSDMGGFAESTNALAKVYQNLSGVSPATARRHIVLAAKNKIIDCKSEIRNGSQTYEYYSKN